MDERRGLPSASSAERLTLCPASHGLGLTAPEPPESEVAGMGTRIHSVLAGEVGAACSDDEMRIADLCVMHMERLLEQTFGDEDVDITHELRLWHNDKASGQLDVLAVSRSDPDSHDGRGLVIDFKTGRGEVEHAARNMQLRWQAVLARKHASLTEVTVAIIQPYAEGDKVTTCLYSSSTLDMAEREMDKVLELVADETQQPNPSAKACKYCRAATICPAAHKEVTELAKVDTTALSGDRVAELLASCELAEKIITHVRNHARSILDGGGEVPGWQLRPGVIRQSITDLPGLYARLNASHEVSGEEFADSCTATKGKVKALLKDKTQLKGRQLDEELNAMLDGFTDSKQSSPQLKRLV